MSDSPSLHQRYENRAADSAAERQPHVVMDLPSRRFKGLKISRLQPMHLLSAGTGAVDIAYDFAPPPKLRSDVTGVGVCGDRFLPVSRKPKHA